MDESFWNVHPGCTESKRWYRDRYQGGGITGHSLDKNSQSPSVASVYDESTHKYGIDTVKAKDVDMSGNPVYYPKTDGTEIYRKQLQADGRSRIFVYRLINPEEQQQPKAEEKPIDIEAMFNQLRNDVCSEISEIKSMFPTQMSGTSEPKQNGGKQR